jgi:pSer/pThr/pTyr-binding forkhead associated (FHA) protein
MDFNWLFGRRRPESRPGVRKSPGVRRDVRGFPDPAVVQPVPDDRRGARAAAEAEPRPLPDPAPHDYRPRPAPPRTSGVESDQTVLFASTSTRIAGVLAVIDGDPPVKLFAIHEGENAVGREAGARVHIPFPTVSRRHAVIHCTNGSFSIQALAADRRNPTFLNERPVDREILSDGDVIRVSTVSLKFRVM